MSKGSLRRPLDPRYCSPEQVDKNYERIFGAREAEKDHYCLRCRMRVKPVVSGDTTHHYTCPYCHAIVRPLIDCDRCKGSGHVEEGLCPKCLGGKKVVG